MEWDNAFQGQGEPGPPNAVNTHILLIRKAPILQLGEHQLSVDFNLKGPWYKIKQ